MGMNSEAYLSSAWTTGAGIVIGTNVDISGCLMSGTNTVTVKADGTTMFICSGINISFSKPISLTGAVTATSSAGNFTIFYRQRPV